MFIVNCYMPKDYQPKIDQKRITKIIAEAKKFLPKLTLEGAVTNAVKAIFGKENTDPLARRERQIYYAAALAGLKKIKEGPVFSEAERQKMIRGATLAALRDPEEKDEDEEAHPDGKSRR